MPLTPRFGRVVSADRRFVDREVTLEVFDRQFELAGRALRLLNIVGVGGIGKSRTLKEMSRRVEGRARVGLIDLQVPALRQPENALAVLRAQFGKQGVRFDRFDIAYLVLWQRLNPHQPLSRSGIPFAEESDLVAQVAGDVAGLPVFGTAIGLLRLVESMSWSVRRARGLKRDHVLRQLDDLSLADVRDAVVFLFAEGLRDAPSVRTDVVFFDAYEALVPPEQGVGRAPSSDVWVRDLVGQLRRGLVVVASREPLAWPTYDADWADHIVAHELDGLPMRARLELLDASGADPSPHRDVIADASAGLPFYLHLALDTLTAASRELPASLVTTEEILQRFLEHVDSGQIAILRLLSCTRWFDYAVFRDLADAYGMPGHRPAWELLTAYSFVHAAESSTYQLHQLMGAAMRNRLSATAEREVHAVLYRVHRAQGELLVSRDDLAESRAENASAFREAVFHGTRSGQIGPTEILRLADRARPLGGAQVIEGIAADVQQTAAAAPPNVARDLDRVGAILQAEAAVISGEGARARELVAAPAGSLDDVLAARSAMAAAQAARLVGDTQRAIDGFTRVWCEHDGDLRWDAGLWAADLHMCQGRFVQAEELASDLDSDRPTEWHEFSGDIARLRHLGRRLSFDFDGAAVFLARAHERYSAANAGTGLAMLITNRAELESLTDPESSLVTADAAIRTHRDLGMGHELGKSYTALAIAQLTLGRLQESSQSLSLACEILDQVKYRSGRARAELVAAFLAYRGGDLDASRSTAERAIAELESAQVYPIFVLAAVRFLERLGAGGTAAASARSALRKIHVPYSTEVLEGKVAWFIERLGGFDAV